MDAGFAFANEVAAQWAGSMWSAVWQSTALAAGLFILTRFLKGAPASLRYWLWMLVPLRLLVMPVLTVSLPVLPAPLPEAPVEAFAAAPMASVVPATDPTGGFDLSAQAPSASDTPVATVPAVVEPRRPRAALPLYAMAAWGAGVLLLTLRMARGWWWMRRLVAQGERVADGPLVDALCKAVVLLGLKGLPRLVVTDATVSPFTCGVRRPVIVLPRAFVMRVDKHGLLAVLAHECAHIRRRDSLLGVVLGVCDMFYFFHPILHWVKRRAFFERERACDDLVLATSKAKPSAYANAICTAAQLASGIKPLSSPPVLVAESFGDLKRRLAALAPGTTPRAKLSRGSLASLVALGAVCVPGVVLTGAAPLERPLPARPNDTVLAQAAPSAPPQSTVPQRIIHFPKDRALGAVSVRRVPVDREYRLGPNYNAASDWDIIGAAQGDVPVPVGKEIKLTVRGRALLQDLSPLRALRPDDLQALEFYCEEGTRTLADLRIMPHIAGLTGLRELELWLPDLSDQGMQYLQGLTALQHMYIRSAYVTDAGMSQLANLQSLRTLWAYVSVTDRGLAHVGRLSALRELSIKCTGIRGPGLRHLAGLRGLEFLELQGANFGDDGIAYMESLPGLKSLTLRGEDLRITDRGMPYLARLVNLEELRFIRAENVTDAGIAYLTALPKLRMLELHHAVTTDATLARLSTMQTLEDLELSNNPRSVVSDVGLSYLTRLKHLKRLWAMGSDRRPVTDAGLKYLSTISSLRELSVSGGEGITDTGIGYLSELSQLQNLSIATGSHHLTDASLAHIGKLTNLRNLYVYGPGEPFTTSGLNQINGLTQLRTLRLSSAKSDGTTLDWSNLTNLEDLIISLSPLSDNDLVSIGKLTRLKRLQGIGGISDAGLANLAGLSGLHLVSIQKSHLTDEGLQHIANMKKLESLTVSGSFTGAGFDYIVGARGLQRLTIESATPISGQLLTNLQSRLPNLDYFSVNGSAGPVAGYGG